MSAKVISLISAAYVRDLATSRRFYEAVGFQERTTGHNELSAWASLWHGQHSIVLVTSTPPLDVPALPLLFYFYVDDLDAAAQSLRAGGYPTAHVGYPPHASGGEAKTIDPDGNTILLGQKAETDSPAQPPRDDSGQRFSLLREAAALARQRAEANVMCQVGNLLGGACERQAQVKLADGWGDSAWACLPHAEEALVTAPGVFIAKQDQDKGLATFLAARKRRIH